MAMNSWTLASMQGASASAFPTRLERWPQHVAYFDGAVQTFFDCNWIHPWLSTAAEIVRNGRLFAASPLIIPAHAVELQTDPVFPNDEPGSEEEAKSHCLFLLTLAVVRSLARAGFLAFAGVPMESIAIHRRTLETLLHIDVLVDNPSLALDCFRLARQTKAGEARRNPFRREVENANSRLLNKASSRDQLTPMQAELRRSAHCASLHTAPHAGILHGMLGVRPDLDAVDPFDVTQEVGMYAWRVAAQTIQVATPLTQKLPWVDHDKWSESVSALREKAAGFEAADRRRRGVSPDHETPWAVFSASDDGHDAAETSG